MKFAKREAINLSIKDILRTSKKHVFIVTPYIKFNDEIKSELERLESKDKLTVRILFGKNENERDQSLSFQDLEFLKKIPNIDIRFEESLHAKFYCNEKKGIITSMNLHAYSQKNNIECGVILNSSNSVYREAIEYFEDVFFNSEYYYSRKPVYKKVFFGLFRKYVQSEELVNFKVPRKLTSISNNQGFCIRTGERIALNHFMPYSLAAYRQWARTFDKFHKENYCHYTGEKSDGSISFARPISKKNWAEYKNKYDNSTFASNRIENP